jgi:hypothetical protein
MLFMRTSLFIICIIENKTIVNLPNMNGRKSRISYTKKYLKPDEVTNMIPMLDDLDMVLRKKKE